MALEIATNTTLTNTPAPITIGNMPVGGEWALTQDLAITGGNIAIDGSLQFATFNKEIVCSLVQATTYVANTWYDLGTTTIPTNSSYIVQAKVQMTEVSYHLAIGAGILSVTYWHFSGVISETILPMNIHNSTYPTIIRLRPKTGQGNRVLQFSFDINVTVINTGFIEVVLKKIF